MNPAESGEARRMLGWLAAQLDQGIQPGQVLWNAQKYTDGLPLQVKLLPTLLVVWLGQSHRRNREIRPLIDDAAILLDMFRQGAP